MLPLKKVPIVMHSKYPVHVMVLGVVSSDRDVMEPIFIPDGLHLGANSYVRLLNEHVKPWMDMVANGRLPYIFQQDSAPAHRTSQASLFANVPYHWSPNLWPSSLPNCNPLDYFVWGVLESEINSRPYNNKKALKVAIRDVIINMDRNAIAKACFNFQSSLEKVVGCRWWSH